jgi:SAM-dependent methyltransferase
MLLSALTVFASAFLLFLVQPLIAKQILPWFGGSAAVWTTCLVFFQAALTAGYAYADAIARLRPRTQALLHMALLAGSLLALPIVPAAHWKPDGSEAPLGLILGLLTATIGLPYFLLATTSPLVQSWFARAHPARSPYRLFALSNLASLLALLGYPFLLEPWVPTRAQALAWSAAYAVFAVLCASLAWRSRVAPATAIVIPGAASTRSVHEAPVPGTLARGTLVASAVRAPTLGQQLLWMVLALTGSMLLLAITEHVTQNVAAVPLLWVLPLAIYLVTFVLCFEGRAFYRRSIFLPMAAAALGVMAWAMADTRLTHELALQLGAFTAGLFLACMFCHGELARAKPPPRWLTRYYLMISVGGAVGAALVGVLAPLTLPAQFELALTLCLCAFLLVWQARRAPLVFMALGLAAVIATVTCGVWHVRSFYDDTITVARNFYGVLRVQESGASAASLHRSLIHGTIMHGNQYLAPQLRREPTSYYTATSGIGRVLESLHPRLEPVRVGVIGLGTGTLATYGARGDTFRFYDINPAVVQLARSEFTYLADSDAHVDTVLGDARLSLEREPPQQLDVLAIDAFSSDAIPVHLITVEALDVYRRHVKPGGVIAFHVTNRYLDLVPVVQALAQARGLRSVWIDDDGDGAMASRSDWVLLSDGDILDRPRIAEAAKAIVAHPGWRLWTDDFNNLFQVLKRDG